MSKNVSSILVLFFLSFFIFSCGKTDENKKYSQNSSSQDNKKSREYLLDLNQKSVLLNAKIHVISSYLNKFNGKVTKNNLILLNLNFGKVDQSEIYLYPVRIDAYVTLNLLKGDIMSDGKISDIVGIPYLLKEIKSEYNAMYPKLSEIIEQKNKINEDIYKVEQIFKEAIKNVKNNVPKNTDAYSFILKGNEDFKGLEHLLTLTSEATTMLY
ncbi:hypothetical protein QEJ31_14445 [Pigmentibacter sp. JX0631]|uniref:hypothetical protein n=1 Tax=Pigmentibacter sp. JX0631 TaxID=2976982 RepID=UPI002468DC62|nr:hypothetical protein [Pigmentibacter sp. JX0631]WGL59729.1 hypothetical protein QEJ31_14445 [Pigmentibacter sp. JX0631]